MFSQKSPLLLLQILCFALISFPGKSQNYTSISGQDLSTVKGPSLGSAWIDFNNDGLEDIFVFNYANTRNFLFKNLGNGLFENYGSEPIVTDLSDSDGGSWADYNNDGYPDLFVSNYSGRNFLYKNNGGGFTTGNGFTKITTGVLVTDTTAAWDASWVDYNNDGLLDVYVNTNNKNFLYKNLGNDQFEKIMTGNIVNDNEASFGTAWGDYNNDGFIDLFVANYGNQNNSLYKNKGDGTFQKIVTGAIVNDGGQSRSASWGDYNNDGFLDLYVTNSGQLNFLYRNNGNETFTKITNDPIVKDDYWSYSSTWTDYNNDGYIDMAVVNSTSNDSVSLFRNNKNGTFTRIRDTSLLATGTSSWSLSPADFNNDGYEDLYVAGRGYNKGYLFKNINTGNKFLSIKLKGIQSNANGIGARIRVKGNSLWQTRQVTSKSGRGGQGSYRMIFGMDQASSADSIVIYWPGNKRQVLLNKTTNQAIVIEECTPYNGTEVKQICSGESFSFGNALITNPGNYTHTYLSKQGCDSTVALTLTVRPVFDIQAGKKTLCEGESFLFGGNQLSQSGDYVHTFESRYACDSVVHITIEKIAIDKTIKQEGTTLVSNQDNATYQWLFSGGTPIAGATQRSFTPVTSGEYAVMIYRNLSGVNCSLISNKINFIMTSAEASPTGIISYPNPVRKNVIIRLPHQAATAKLCLRNMNGQLLQQWSYSKSDLLDLDLQEIVPGVYILEIITGNNLQRLKLVREE